MSSIQGWHAGERAIQEKLGFDGPMRSAYTWIQGEMPEEHRVFYTTRLPFIPVTTLDASGRPWSSIFAGPSGAPGFASSPSWDKIDMNIRVWDGDPFVENAKLAANTTMLVAGIGIEFSTRRRNKFAGQIIQLRQESDSYYIQMLVNQAIGNCPKYINVRQLDPYLDTKPAIIAQKSQLNGDERLPDDIVNIVTSADTVFLSTAYKAPEKDAIRFPSHLGQNQRGGRPGFVRVRPSDGRTIVLPDYSGNRLLTSLGNIEATPLAGLTVVDFVTGDILYLTGDAHTLVGAEAEALMPRQKVLTTLYVTGYVLVQDALPVRQRLGTSPQRSPYSPPIHLLAEEAGTSSLLFDQEVTATLASIRTHSDDLATFTWETSKPVNIIPGQTAVLNFAPLVGATKYAHMAPYNPSSVNDDRLRTWTVSDAKPFLEGSTLFSLTMREKPGGAVTGVLFTIARKIASMKPELLQDSRPMGLQVLLSGVTGEFTLPLSAPHLGPGPRSPLLLVAGGIGVTPFLSMLRHIVRICNAEQAWDVVLVLSTREPDVLLPLISSALEGGNPSSLHMSLHVFSNKPVSDSAFPALSEGERLTTWTSHAGRISQAFFTSDVPDFNSRIVYLCGPEEFEKSVLRMVGDAGGDNSAVRRESFEY